MSTDVLKNPEEIFFISDTHFHHANIIEYCDRPFGSVGEMDRAMIDNWNNKVPHGSFIYILGDFCFGDRKMWIYFLSQLSGNKILIQGNHDRSGTIPMGKFVNVHLSSYLNIVIKDPDASEGNQRITLCHYPMLSWYHSDRGAWQLFGHVHGRFTNSNKISLTQMDVGVDSINFTPISYQEVKNYITAFLREKRLQETAIDLTM